MGLLRPRGQLPDALSVALAFAARQRREPRGPFERAGVPRSTVMAKLAAFEGGAWLT